MKQPSQAVSVKYNSNTLKKQSTPYHQEKGKYFNFAAWRVKVILKLLSF
jgi:hypothetical protein